MDIVEHTLPRPKGLIECKTVLDVGAGIRPFGWYTPEKHICIEPFAGYAVRLRFAGFEVLEMTAIEALRNVRAEAIYLFDVIEHMDTSEALEVLALAKEGASKQVIVFTPMGFVEQHGDAWGLGGDYWQEHRSGWTPDDFPGWRIEHYGKGFIATWDRE